MSLFMAAPKSIEEMNALTILQIPVRNLATTNMGFLVL
jgi:hypothetical protein